MEPSRSINELVERTRCVVRVSTALFGYVFELEPGATTFLHGCPLAGSIQNDRILRTYYKSIGNRALELLAQGQDQAVPVTPPTDADSVQKDWFAVLITQSLGVAACIAIVYPFYDREEAVRTLHLVEMIMTTKPLK